MSVLFRVLNAYSIMEYLLHARDSDIIFIRFLWFHKAVSTTFPKSHSAPIDNSQMRKSDSERLGTYSRSHSKSEGARSL